MVHAEMNALLNANGPVKGYTLYVTPFMPCDRCAIHMIQAGITRIVSYRAMGDRAKRWSKSFLQTNDYLREANVTLDIIEKNPTACTHGTRLTKFCKECAQLNMEKYLTEHGEEPPYLHSQETL